jgi:hypothetical protein
LAHYEDLTTCDYFGAIDGALLAVGWLQRDRPFTKGRVEARFFGALVELAIDPWQPFAFAGLHRCEFCRFTGGPGAVYYENIAARVGAENLFVPGDGAMYVAPSTILHYIDAHEYAPPEEFQRAVLACPPMRSMEYLKALRAAGVHRLRETSR